MTNVHILVTCRDKSLLPYSVLVFKTIRVGFPTAKIICYLNQVECRDDIINAIPEGVEYSDVTTIHHAWLEQLVKTEQESFWICDTDVSFWGKVEDWAFDKALAGRRIPEWKDEFSNAVTRARLHPSMMWIDPVKVREKIKAYEATIPATVFTPGVNLFHPLVLPFKEERIFYDTLGFLYHAIGGQAFTDRQLDAYDHFNFGAIPDIVLPRLSNGAEMLMARNEALGDPSKFRGAWRWQQEYYEARRLAAYGKPVIAPIDPDDAIKARKWNEEMCCGNQDAMFFNDLWYSYVHSIDDLVDTMEDGRPVMSRDEMIGLFFKAAMFYNCKFWRTYSEMLFPIVLQITNEYADSVAWEKSPKPHLRTMGDVMRTCGNTMFKMVAFICGGENHMKLWGRKIQERDFLEQHTEDGYPK